MPTNVLHDGQIVEPSLNSNYSVINFKQCVMFISIFVMFI